MNVLQDSVAVVLGLLNLIEESLFLDVLCILRKRSARLEQMFLKRALEVLCALVMNSAYPKVCMCDVCVCVCVCVCV